MCEKKSMAQARLQLKPHLSSVALRHRYRKCKEAKEARRWHALWLMSGGASTQEAAALVGCASSWVRRCATRYNQLGPEGVRDGHCRRPGGGRRRLTAKQEEQLGHALEREPPGGRAVERPESGRVDSSEDRQENSPPTGLGVFATAGDEWASAAPPAPERGDCQGAPSL